MTTGFGKLSDVAIPSERLAELQVNLVRSHAAGVGDLLPEREVRAMMLLRANVITKGYSGARPDLAELLLAMLNAGLHPPIPEQGSVGASGDLAPLAHLALSLIGEGTLRRGDRSGAAAAMLRAAGLEPITLASKEGLTLINGTQAHTAIARWRSSTRTGLWRMAHVAGAMSLEALLGTPVAFDSRIQDVRGQLGQAASAALPPRAAGRQRDSRVASPRRFARAGCVRAALHAAGARAGARRARLRRRRHRPRAQCRDGQSARLREAVIC